MPQYVLQPGIEEVQRPPYRDKNAQTRFRK